MGVTVARHEFRPLGTGARSVAKSLRILRRSGLYLCVLLILLWTLGPILWVVRASVSLPKELLSRPIQWLPREPTLLNYEQLFGLQEMIKGSSQMVRQFPTAMWNSTFVAVWATLLCILVGSVAAYAFARLKFRGRVHLLSIILFTQMLPGIAIVIPLYIVMRQMRLTDTLQGLILTYTSFTLPFTIWILRGFFQTIPSDLEDAAMVDGCSRLGALFKIVFPLAAPGLVTAALFAFMGAWNEFFFALIFTSTNRSKVITVALSQFSTEAQVDIPLSAAASMLASILPLFLYFAFQRFILRGLTAGALKG